MSGVSRRKLITRGLTAAAGLSGLALAERIANRYGLIPPDYGGVYGPGETLTYAAQRLLTGRSLAREFDRTAISKEPFADETSPPTAAFKRLQNNGFKDWKLSVDGLVRRPVSFSLDDLKRLPVRSQITQIACEEGWSYVAEWTGTPLSAVLNASGVRPNARYVVYYSSDPNWWDSIDMDEAMHPQTLLAWGMNGADLPVPFGGPLRMRIPRQLGYKSVKFIDRIVVTDSLKGFGNGMGQSSVNDGYAWYAGI